MNSRTWMAVSAGTGVIGTIFCAVALCAEPSTQSSTAPSEPKGNQPAATGKQPEDGNVAVARAQAKLMHDIYSSTLDRLHHHYFHGNDRAAVPARVMEDVFAEMEETSKIEATWIAVNTRAMSIDHQAETPFEKKAAAQLSDGKTDFEQVENGFYQRATVIPLTDGCLGCHTGLSRAASTFPRFAAWSFAFR